MANIHYRSNSFPSQSHPSTAQVQEILCRLKSSAETSTSTRTNLGSLKDLHEGINHLIQMPSIQQSLSNKQGENWMNELLEGSLRLVDLCGFSRDVVRLTKESVQELESSIRRSRGEEDINAYLASRKKIEKMVSKNLKNFNKNTAHYQDYDLNSINTILKEAESLGFSVLRSSLTIFSGAKGRSNEKGWSFLSKITQKSRVDEKIGALGLCSLNIPKLPRNAESEAVKSMLKQLKSSEMVMQELEEGVESLYRSLVKTRVFLLNVLSH